MSQFALNRRQIIKGMGFSLGVLALRGYQVQAKAAAYFTHGIASGDPLSDRVILWTRVIPGSGKAESVVADWQVSLKADFSTLVASGQAKTDAGRDYTVKVDAEGLKPGQSYYYRFAVDGVFSPVGKTKTLPIGSVSEYKIGVTSCSNYPQGYFNAYQDMSKSDLDVIMHLGDYIYEYADGVYANAHALESLDRHVKPKNEILSLEDYRMRYGLYRTDVDLQDAHLSHPWICVWDDHELANNVWKDGAENHNEGEGDFATRMKFARQAYHEWLPIRTPAPKDGGDQGVIYRNFQVGDLADLIMLDARLHGRDEQLSYRHDMIPKQAAFDVSKQDKPMLTSKQAITSAVEVAWVDLPFDVSTGKLIPIADYDKIKGLSAESLPKGWSYLPDNKAFKREKLDNESRSILGLDQEAWLKSQMGASKQRGATWQVLGQQVLMGRVNVPKLKHDPKMPMNQRQKGFKQFLDVLAGDDMPFNLDAWDGYPNSQARVKADLKSEASNPIVLAGDTHNAWIFNLKDDDDKPLGVEIGAPGVTSPGMESFMPASPAKVEAAIKQGSPEVLDVDASQRGWVELILKPEASTAQWRFVDTILDRKFNVTTGQKYSCAAGEKMFKKA